MSSRHYFEPVIVIMKNRGGHLMILVSGAQEMQTREAQIKPVFPVNDSSVD
jgi:hypothetical protein